MISDFRLFSYNPELEISFLFGIRLFTMPAFCLLWTLDSQLWTPYRLAAAVVVVVPAIDRRISVSACTLRSR